MSNRYRFPTCKFAASVAFVLTLFSVASLANESGIGPFFCASAFEKGDPDEQLTIFFLVKNADPDASEVASFGLTHDYTMSFLLSTLLAETARQLEVQTITTDEMLHLDQSVFFVRATGSRRALITLSEDEYLKSHFLWAGFAASREVAVQYGVDHGGYAFQDLQNYLALEEFNQAPSDPAESDLSLAESLRSLSWASAPDEIDPRFEALPRSGDSIVRVRLDPHPFVLERLDLELTSVIDAAAREARTRAFFEEIYVDFIRYIEEIRAEGSVVDFEIALDGSIELKARVNEIDYIIEEPLLASLTLLDESVE